MDPHQKELLRGRIHILNITSRELFLDAGALSLLLLISHYTKVDSRYLDFAYLE